MTEWKFARRQRSCSTCGRVFEDGEVHFSALVVDGEDLARHDGCRTCWRERGAPEALFWWRTRQRLGRKSGLALNVEALLAMFLSLAPRTETQLKELRYVLCLLLMRKRKLEIKRVQREEGTQALVVRRPRQEEEFVVEVFDFSVERMEELRGRLQEVLEGAE